ncbi:MAG: anti-sigma factor family protein [Rhodoplanes sp.]|jgi:anti-sigma factor RsiW
MQCEEARDRIGALIDGELADEPRRDIDAHVAACGGCAQELADLKRLKRQVAAVRAPARPGLADGIRAAVAREAGRSVAAEPGVPAVRIGALRDGMRSRLRPLMRLTAIILVSCLVSGAATWFVLRGADQRATLERDVLSAHVRSLLQDNPVQIASSDTHTVKPWFSGRIEFAPVVTELAAQGYPLAGGRLDYIAGRRVAALVYRRRLHLVTVFMWPSAGEEETRPTSLKANGYNLVTWSKGGMTYWAVSDLNERELQDLQGLL